MSQVKNILLTGILFLFMLLTSAATVRAEDIAGSSEAAAVAESYFEQMLKALGDRDMESFASLWPSEADPEALTDIMDMWSGEKTISYSKLGEEQYMPQEDEGTGMTYQYEVQCENMDAVVTISILDNMEGSPRIVFFNMQTNYHIKQNTPVARGMIIVLAVIAFLFLVCTAHAVFGTQGKPMTKRQKKKMEKLAQKQKFMEMAEQWYQEEERHSIGKKDEAAEDKNEETDL